MIVGNKGDELVLYEKVLFRESGIARGTRYLRLHTEGGFRIYFFNLPPESEGPEWLNLADRASSYTDGQSILVSGRLSAGSRKVLSAYTFRKKGLMRTRYNGQFLLTDVFSAKENGALWDITSVGKQAHPEKTIVINRFSVPGNQFGCISKKDMLLASVKQISEEKKDNVLLRRLQVFSAKRV